MEGYSLPEPIRADSWPLGLSVEEEARVDEILAALPEEAAGVHAAVTRLLFDVISMLESHLVTPSDVDETLTVFVHVTVPAEQTLYVYVAAVGDLVPG